MDLDRIRALGMNRYARIQIISVAMVALVYPAHAQGQKQSGSDLIEACRSIARGITPTPDSALQVGICLGELEALNWFAPGANDENLRSCVPKSVMRQQMATIVVAYLDKNSTRLREPFEGLALEALAVAWPCTKESWWFGKWFNNKAPDE
jgi:Rap1a immunity proteins